MNGASDEANWQLASSRDVMFPSLVASQKVILDHGKRGNELLVVAHDISINGTAFELVEVVGDHPFLPEFAREGDLAAARGKVLVSAACVGLVPFAKRATSVLEFG